jgi:hypothetical protein
MEVLIKDIINIKNYNFNIYDDTEKFFEEGGVCLIKNLLACDANFKKKTLGLMILLQISKILNNKNIPKEKLVKICTLIDNSCSSNILVQNLSNHGDIFAVLVGIILSNICNIVPGVFPVLKESIFTNLDCSGKFIYCSFNFSESKKHFFTCSAWFCKYIIKFAN